MTKKDYVLIAGVIRASLADDTITPAQARALAHSFAVKLNATNARFDHIRFTDAATGC